MLLLSISMVNLIKECHWFRILRKLSAEIVFVWHNGHCNIHKSLVKCGQLALTQGFGKSEERFLKDIVGQLSAVSWPTVGQLLADR